MKGSIKKIIASTIGILLIGSIFTGCDNNVSDNNNNEIAQKGKTERKAEEDKAEEEKAEEVEKIDNSDIEKVGVRFIQELIDKNLHEVKDKFIMTEEMEKMLTDGVIKTQLYPLIDAYGKLIEMKASFKENDFVFIPTIFEKQKINFQVSFKDGKIEGFWLKDFREKDPQKDESKVSEYTEREMSKVVDGFEINGTLLLPDKDKDYPVVVLVHGSGSTDRDENVNGIKPFKDIAMGLAKRGIGTYRYDKRSFTHGVKLIEDQNFNLEGETIKDAVEMVKMLKETEGVDPNKIFVLGHSLGGYAIPRIAEDSEGIRGYIMMAGSAKSLQDVMVYQQGYLANLDGKVTEEEKAKIDAIAAEVDKIKNVANMRSDEKIMNIWKGYWEYMENYDPVELAKEIEEPVLLIQSEDDWQVDMSHYKIWNDEFGKSPNWKFNLYSGLNHLMIKNGGSMMVDEGVIDDIASWIKEN